jgi:CBS domain-containing protein
MGVEIDHGVTVPSSRSRGCRNGGVDPTAFVRERSPFGRLDDAALAGLNRGLEVVYLPAGTRILERGGSPGTHLFLVRSGSVRLERADGLVLLVEEGELFGYRSILTGDPPAFDATAETDVLCYRFPAEVARPLLEHPAVSAVLARGLAERLRAVSPAARVVTLPETGTGIRLRDLIGRAPVIVDPGTPVSDTARVMREAGVSSVLVAGPEPGILTDRDLRNRVLAEDRPADTPVEAVATHPALTLDAGATLLDAVVFMLEHNVHHVVVGSAGHVVGVVTDSDVLRHQARNPLYVLRAVERAEDRAALAGYSAEVADVVRHLAATGVGAASIGRVVSSLNDTLVRTLVRLAEQELGASPAPWAWMVLGSEGRLEQTMLTDQDNALVYAPEAADDEEAVAWFKGLAGRVVDGLVHSGVPRCPGGYMATNWNLCLPAFVEHFRGWMATPDPDALLGAAIFFDFRRVAGTLGLEPLEALLDEAPRAELFLTHLAASVATMRPPIGHFRRILVKNGAVDLKRGAVGPVVALARVYGLATGGRTRATLDRLAAAVEAGVLSREGGENLSEAFRFILDLRLGAQLDELAAGRPMDNDVELDGLAPLERHHLKDALVAIRDALDGLEFTYQASRVR